MKFSLFLSIICFFSLSLDALGAEDVKSKSSKKGNLEIPSIVPKSLTKSVYFKSDKRELLDLWRLHVKKFPKRNELLEKAFAEAYFDQVNIIPKFPPNYEFDYVKKPTRNFSPIEAIQVLSLAVESARKLKISYLIYKKEFLKHSFGETRFMPNDLKKSRKKIEEFCGKESIDQINENLSNRIISGFGILVSGNLVIEYLTENSSNINPEIRIGDQILAVNGKTVTEADFLRKSASKNDSVLKLKVSRNGKPISVTLSNALTK